MEWVGLRLRMMIRVQNGFGWWGFRFEKTLGGAMPRTSRLEGRDFVGGVVFSTPLWRRRSLGWSSLSAAREDGWAALGECAAYDDHTKFPALG